MHHHLEPVSVLFQAANLVIVAGYLSVPFLVLRYLPLTRQVRIAGTAFLILCAGTHAVMAVMGHDGLAWMLWHAVQAVATWWFILGFRRTLQAAQVRRQAGRGRP